MSPVRGIPTSRAYWELKAEQVLNRVFEPEPPIVLEVCDPASLASARSRGPSRGPSLSDGNHTESWRLQLARQPGLLLAGASVTVMATVGMALLALGIWNQSQQAIRQERNMLLIERLRAMGPGTLAASDAPVQAAAPKQSTQDLELPPPPPDGGEAWMDELTSLPVSSTPAASVLKVPVNSRITSPAPAASSAAGDGDSPPQLVGVVQVSGQSGSAIFQLGGSSTSAAVGESIGSSGWRLHSASGDSAVIEKAGAQRRVTISSGF